MINNKEARIIIASIKHCQDNGMDDKFIEDILCENVNSLLESKQLTPTAVVQAEPEKVCKDCKWELVHNHWYKCGLCNDIKHISNL